MKYLLIAAVFVLEVRFGIGQTETRQADWQQKCDYYLEVVLNDVDHTLTGNARFVYTNNSPSALSKMYFHLWPNAYKDDFTDFAKQQVSNGATAFHFSDDSSRGYIEKIDFKLGNESVKWNYLGNQIDIAELHLSKPIQPGETVEITTPFFVKIPGSFSRFGHEGQSYQITQWYPKPAVYDVNGWNQIPYLDQGEFYSEFGKFEVSITLPNNYVVAATGELQEQDEHDFLLDRINNPLRGSRNLTSATETKTITYLQNNIHDFAWFADKRFNVKKEDVTLSNGQVVTAYVYADQTNLNFTDNIKTALNYYSDHCGYYPYSHCSVVKGALKAGGGMEYPMITVVANLGEEVIVHEVGHNWFYGILGSNERLYPWMDESINSYFEHEAIHGTETKPEAVLKNPGLKVLGLNTAAMQIGYRQIESLELHQAIGAPSVNFTNGNYGLMVYGKGADAFGYLKAYLGQDAMDKCFRAYFDKWKYKHPLPSDMMDLFETESGKNLHWFFLSFLNSEDHIDFDVQPEGNGFSIAELGGSTAPFQLGYFKDGKLVKTEWHEGGLERLTYWYPEIDCDVVKIDPNGFIPEVNRHNNTLRKGGAFKTVEPLHIKFMSVIDEPNKTSLNVLPLVGWNIHNKAMFGLWLNNTVLPSKKFSFSASPLYSPSTGDLNGYFKTQYKWARNAPLNSVKAGLKASRFSSTIQSSDFAYSRIVPFVQMDFRHVDKRVPVTSRLTVKSTILSYTPHFDQKSMIQSLLLDTGRSFGKRSIEEQLGDQFFNIEYLYRNGQSLNPFQWKATVQMGMTLNAKHQVDTATNMLSNNAIEDNFIKLNLEFKKRITYKLKGKGLDIRVFGGTFLNEDNSGLYHYRMESGAGKWDYTYDEVLMGRGATEGLFSQQVIENDVFLKERGTFANISQWTLAVNLKSDLPVKLPLGVYFDAFTFNGMKDLPNVEKSEPFIFNGGIQVKIIKDFIEIYVPLFSSKMIMEAQQLQGIEDLGQRITFKLNFGFMQDKSVADVFSLLQR